MDVGKKKGQFLNQQMVKVFRFLLEKNKNYLEYGTYAKFRHKIRKAE